MTDVVLVDQPTAAPTRKWTAARITELVTGALAVATIFGFDLSETVDAEALVGAVVVIIGVVTGVVSYFTRNSVT